MKFKQYSIDRGLRWVLEDQEGNSLGASFSYCFISNCRSFRSSFGGVLAVEATYYARKPEVKIAEATLAARTRRNADQMAREWFRVNRIRQRLLDLVR